MLRRNVLIFHQGALGDFVLTWPLAMALSRLFPQSRVMYVAASQKGALAVVTLDAEELSATKSKVVVTVMRATNGEPLAGGRYELKVGMKKIPRGLTSFLAAVKKAMAKVAPPPAAPPAP